jgi:hypothetical protein
MRFFKKNPYLPVVFFSCFISAHIVQIYSKQEKPIILTPGMVINSLRSKLTTMNLQQRRH